MEISLIFFPRFAKFKKFGENDEIIFQKQSFV